MVVERTPHLPPTPRRYVAAGWHPDDAAAWLGALSGALSHPNAVPPAGFLGGEVVERLMGDAAAEAAQPNGLAPVEVAQVGWGGEDSTSVRDQALCRGQV